MLQAATRASPLARWQTDHVASLLHDAHGVAVQPVPLTAEPDRDLSVPVWKLGGKGAFATEVQAAVLDGRADFAVHSAKDLPSSPTPGLTIAALPTRGDPRDVLVGCRLADLAPGARIATGSARRRVQLADLRPDLTFVELRGAMHTRLERIADHSAGVVAAAALERLGLTPDTAEILDPAVVVPQAGQGALAVECRSDDQATVEMLAAIDDESTRRCVTAERAFLAGLGGDCSLPAGAHATIDGATVHLRAVLASADGAALARATVAGPEPEALGAELARRLGPIRDR